MGNNVPRRHHTVPRLYLSRFRDPKIASKHPQTWAVNADSGITRRASVTNETVQTDFYGPFEPFLAKRIDTTRIATLFDRIEEGDAFAMSGEDLGAVLFYMALQLTRTEAFRSIANEMMRENILEGLRVDRRVEARNALVGIVPGQPLIQYPLPEHIRMMLEVGHGISDHLRRMRIFVVRASASRSFITSDCPVAIGPFFDGQTRSLGLRDDAVAFALSPRTALLMSNHLPEYRYVEARAREDRPKVDRIVADINRLIARRCSRWLYGASSHFPTELGLHFPLERFRTVTRRIAPGLVRTEDVLMTDRVRSETTSRQASTALRPASER